MYDSPESLNENSSDRVDELADSLAKEHNNPDFRKWYCSLIYKFGMEQVLSWRQQAARSETPGKLFAHLVKKHRQDVAKHGVGTVTEKTTPTWVPDTIVEVVDDKPINLDDIIF